MYAYLCATNHQIYICYVTAILQTFKYAKKKSMRNTEHHEFQVRKSGAQQKMNSFFTQFF